MPLLSGPLRNTSSPREQEPELSKLEQWQRDRIERKLRSEHESAVLHLSDLIHDNLSTPLRIASVRVENAPNTRHSFLNSIINPVVANASTSDLQSVLYTTKHISHILQKSDIFQHLEARIEGSKDQLSGPDDVDIVFKAHERSRRFLNTATELGNGEGSLSITGRLRNVFGGAELLEANLSSGTKTRRSYRASLSAPLSQLDPTLNTYGEISVFGLERDNSSFASSSEGTRGVKASVRHGQFGSNRGTHELAYEAIMRHIDNLTPTASISMRQAAGHSLKSSISHTYTLDTRDDRLTPSQGVYLKISQELAGLPLGGDTSFYKTQAEGIVGRCIFPGVNVSLSAKSGVLWGLGERPTLFSDRFQLGGPMSIRGFRANSMGPRDGSDSLGGDIYWSTGLSVISNIPRKSHWPVKTHFFVNAGRLDVVDRSKPLQNTVTDLLSRPSISAGVGLIYKFDPVRVEVNFALPLVASASDGARRGFQVGMGLEFL